MKPPPEPNRSQIETFVLTLFKHATPGNWISLRAFFEDRPARHSGSRHTSSTAISMS